MVTLEEFKDAAFKEFMQYEARGASEEEVRKFFEEEEFDEFAEAVYNESIAEYRRGEITEEQIMGAGVSIVSGNLGMLF